MKLFTRLWQEECGATYCAELIFVATLLVIGLIPAVATLRDALSEQFQCLADAVADHCWHDGPGNGQGHGRGHGNSQGNHYGHQHGLASGGDNGDGVLTADEFFSNAEGQS